MIGVNFGSLPTPSINSHTILAIPIRTSKERWDLQVSDLLLLSRRVIVNKRVRSGKSFPSTVPPEPIRETVGNLCTENHAGEAQVVRSTNSGASDPD
jgi:hypothetical protein